MTAAPARSTYIVSPEGHTGKSVVALGLVDLLTRRVKSVGVFRPVTTSTTGDDQVVKLLLRHDGVDLAYESCVGVTYEQVHADPDAALATIIERYHAIESTCEFVVIVGSDYTDIAGPTELTFNARVATNLGAPGAARRERASSGLLMTVAQLVEIATAELTQAHATTVGIIANRCDPGQLDAVRDRLSRSGLPAWAVPETPLLSAPLVADLMTALDGELLFGDEVMLQPRGRAHAGVRDERRARARAVARRSALHRRRRSPRGPRRARLGTCRRRLPVPCGHRAERWLPARVTS